MGQRFYNQDKELIFADGAAAVVASGAGQAGNRAYGDGECARKAAHDAGLPVG